MKSSEVFIVAAQRTPIGSFLGSLSGFSATQLGAIALKGAMTQATSTLELVGTNSGNGVSAFNTAYRADAQPVNAIADELAKHIDELYFGNVMSANLGQSPASQVAYYAGLNKQTPCTVINKVCASGMKSVMMGAQTIQSGDNQIVAAGGMESMSNVPHYLPGGRTGSKYGNIQLLDGINQDGLLDVYNQYLMGTPGEMTAKRFEISREEQDAFAIRSFQLANESIRSGAFHSEIAPIAISTKKGDTIFADDEGPAKVIYEKIPTLKPAFQKDGTITAANASTMNDGASALILASSDAVKNHHLRPIARIVSFADAALEPEWFTIAPEVAIQRALKKANLTINDIDTFEINEAFAVVVLANMKLLNIPLEKVNLMGGAISLGHPLGSSGSRIIVTAITSLARTNGKYALAAICNGGGGASAIIIERL
ncbi:MAG: acetyl-CoA C-acyltransferase [Bacteroidia bacterium]|nr:acetyl-CoA C-acyltransferase [Bacteroidia bacterium]